jgi:hypothetical protein
MARTPPADNRKVVTIRNPKDRQIILTVLRVRMHPQVRVTDEWEVKPDQALTVPIGDEHEIIIRESPR